MNPNLLESAEFYNRRYHNFSSRIVIPTLFLFLFGVAFLAFVKKEIAVTSTATVEPSHIISNIQSTNNTTIKVNNLEENKKVQVGDLLVEYDKENEDLQLTTTQEQLSELETQKGQLELLKSSLESGQSQFSEVDKYGYYQSFIDYLNQAESISENINQQNANTATQNAAASNQQAEIGNTINDLENQVSDYRAARSAIQNGSSLDSNNQAYSIYQSYQSQLKENTQASDTVAIQNQFLTQIDSQINQLQTSIANYRIQYAGSGAQQAYSSTLDNQLASLKAQNILKVEQEITTLNQKILELTGTKNLQESATAKTTIVAKETGILHLNQEVVGSNVVPEGTILAQIYPEIKQGGTVKLVSYLPSSTISSVKIGDKVRFSTQDDKGETVNIETKITSIDNSATRTEKGNFFKVESIVKLTEKETQLMKYGSEGRVLLITGKKSYLSYYLDEFLGQK